MINKDRIVPITKLDLISMYGVILKVGSVNVTKLDATDVEGDFSAAAGTYRCSQPVKSFDFTGASGTVYFVPDYAYEGFTKSGAAVTMAGADVEADGATLYSATLSSGTVTIAKIAF